MGNVEVELCKSQEVLELTVLLAQRPCHEACDGDFRLLHSLFLPSVCSSLVGGPPRWQSRGAGWQLWTEGPWPSGQRPGQAFLPAGRPYCPCAHGHPAEDITWGRDETLSLGKPCSLTGAAGIEAPVSFWGALDTDLSVCPPAAPRPPSRTLGVSPSSVCGSGPTVPGRSGSLVSVSGGPEWRCWWKPSFSSGGSCRPGPFSVGTLSEILSSSAWLPASQEGRAGGHAALLRNFTPFGFGEGIFRCWFLPCHLLNIYFLQSTEALDHSGHVGKPAAGPALSQS